MAIGETIVTVVGNVLSEVSRRTVPQGYDVVSFWLRSNERKRDRETGDWVDGRQLSVKVTCWRKLAESVHASVHKGDPVLVQGRLYTSQFEVEGQTRVVPELEALAVGPNLSFCTAAVQRPGKPPADGESAAVPWQRSDGAALTSADGTASEPVGVG
jgi:single-strand DNA-binding protein